MELNERLAVIDADEAVAALHDLGLLAGHGRFDNDTAVTGRSLARLLGAAPIAPSDDLCCF